MKKLFRKLFGEEKEVAKINPIYFRTWQHILEPKTAEERFRIKTIDDINGLLSIGNKTLAALETEKLIAHLKKELGN